MELKGIDVGENMGTISDTELLMEIMETREFLEDASNEELRALGDSNRAKIDKLETELAPLFASNGILILLFLII